MTREFSVVVGIDASRARRGGREFKAGADQVVRSSQRMNTSLKATNKSALALVTTIGRIRGVATLAFAGFLGVGGIGAVVKTMAQFEASMKRVEALLGDRAVGGAMQALTMRARELGATTAFTASQAAEGMQFLTLAGFDALETFQAIGPALELAQAGMLGLGEAADIVSNIMQGFNIDASETQDVVDALAFVSTRTNTSIRQLGEAMKFVAPVAGALGLSVEETSAALGLLGNSGLQASLAGTSLRRVLSGLLGPSKEASKLLEDMGLNSNELIEALGDPSKGLVFVINKLKDAGLGAAEAFTLFGQRGAPGILSLINQTDELENFNEQMTNIAGTARTIGTVMIDNLQGDARIALSAVQEAIIRLGEAGLLEWLREATQAFTAFVRGLADIDQNLENSSEKIQKWARAGVFMRENAEAIRKTLVVLVAFMNRALIATLVGGAAKLVLFAVNMGRVVVGIRNMIQATAVLAVAMKGLRAAIASTGVGALAVAIGFLLDWLIFSKDAEEQNNRTEVSFNRLASKVEDLAFRFNLLTEEQRKYAIQDLETLMTRQQGQIVSMERALINQATATERITQAQADQAAALEILAKKGLDAESSTLAAVRAGRQYKEAQEDLREATDRLNEAQILFNSGAHASGEELANLRAEVEKNELRLRAWRDVQAGTFKTVEEAIAAYNGAKNAVEEYSKAVQDQTGLSDKQLVQLAALLDEYNDQAKGLSELEEQIALINLARENEQALTDANVASNGQLAMTLRELQFEYETLKQKLSPAEKAAKKWQETLEDLRDGNDELAQAERENQREIERLTALWRLSGTDSVELEEALKRQADLHEANIEKINAQCKKTEDLKTCMDENSKKMTAIWDQALRNIQDAFADAFRNIGNGFDDFADSLLDAFKELLAQMAAQAAINNIFGNGNGFFTDFFGGLSGGGSGGGGIGGIFGNVVGGGGGGGGIFGGGGGAGAGGTGGIGGQIGSAIQGSEAFQALAAGATAFAQGFGAFFGIGQSAQLVSGTGAFGVGGSSAAVANVGGSGAAVAGSVTAGAGVGALTGAVADAILGGRGDSTRNAIFSTIGGAIGSIWGPIGSVIGGAIGSFVDNLIGGAKKLESAVIELDVTNGEIFAVQEEVISKQRSFFRGRKFTTTRRNITNQFQQVENAFKEFAEGLKVQAESIGATTDFLDTFSFSQDVNVKGKNGEERLKQALDNLFLAAIRSFVRDVEGLSDSVKKTLQVYQNNLEDFGRAFDAAAGIERLFDIDLIEGAITQVEEANVGLIGTYENAAEAFRNVIAEYDGSVESLEELSAATAIFTQVQLDLVATYQEVGRQISGLFQGSAQTIQEALLNEEELYNLRRSQIDDLVAQAAMTTDPEELARLADQINTLGLDAFNLLDEGQQQELGQEFIDFFNELDTLFADQVDTGIEGVLMDQAELDQEVADKMLEAAEALLEAARQANRDRERGPRRGGRRELYD